MQTCTQCNTDTLYPRETDYRCALCGEIHKHKTGLIDEQPCRPHDSDCGELLQSDIFPEKNLKSPLKKRMCNDNTCCEVTPSSVSEIDGQYFATCYYHDESDAE